MKERQLSLTGVKHATKDGCVSGVVEVRVREYNERACAAEFEGNRLDIATAELCENGTDTRRTREIRFPVEVSGNNRISAELAHPTAG